MRKGRVAWLVAMVGLSLAASCKEDPSGGRGDAAGVGTAGAAASGTPAGTPGSADANPGTESSSKAIGGGAAGAETEASRCPGGASTADGWPIQAPSSLLALAPASALTERDWFSEAAALASNSWLHADGVVLQVESGKPLLSRPDLRVSVGGDGLAVERSYVEGRSADGLGPGWSLDLGPASSRCGRPGAACDPEGRVLALAAGGQTLNVEWKEGRPAALRHGVRQVLELEWDGQGRILAIRTPDGRSVAYRFDSAGRLAGATGPAGSEDFAYDQEGRLVSVVGPAGTLGLQWDRAGGIDRLSGPGRESTVRACVTEPAGGRSCRIIDSVGATTTFEFASGGREVQVTDPLGGVLVKKLDPAGRPLQILRNGRQAGLFSWDGEGRLTSVVYPGGVSRGFVWKDGRLTEVRGPSSAILFEYGALGLPSAVVDEDGGRHTFLRDSCGRLVEETGPRGDKRRLAYDSEGFLSEVQDDGGRRAFVRGASGLVESVTEPSGAVTRVSWDAARNLARRTDALGETEEWTWDAGGRVVSYRDALGRTTRFEYEASGRLSSVTRTAAGAASSRQVKLTRDARGLPVQVTAPTGTQRMDWDALGRLSRVEDEAGIVEEWVRDPDGRPVERRLNGAVQWTGTWDEAGRLTTERLGDGWEIVRTYDERGRIVRTREPGRTLVYVYGGDGSIRAEDPDRDVRYRYRPYGLEGQLRLDVVEGPGERRETHTWAPDGSLLRREVAGGESETWTYDALGRPSAVVSTLSGTRKYSWDAAGRPVSFEEASGVVRTFEWAGDGASVDAGLAGAKVHIGLDPSGRPVSIDPGIGATAFTWDASGRLTEKRYPDGLGEKLAWDAGGRLVGITRADGVREDLLRDDRGRLVLHQVGGQTVRQLGYDAVGNPVVDEGPSYRLTSRFDVSGNLASRKEETTGIEVTYGRDASGRPTVIGLPGGNYIARSYDAAGRLTRTEGPGGMAVSVGYDRFGRRASIRYGDSAVLTIDRDLVGRVVRQSVADRTGRDVYVAAYEYDPAGRLVRTDYDGRTLRYAYQSGRLSRVDLPDGSSKEYRYDGAGNLVTAGEAAIAHGPLGEVRSTPDGARRHLPTGELAEFSAGGRKWSLEWTPAGQLSRALSDGAEVAAYAFEGDGNLLLRRDAAAVTHFVVDRGDVVAEAAPAGATGSVGQSGLDVVRVYLPGEGLDERLAFRDNGETYFVVPDLNGSTLAVLDKDGNLVNRYLHEPFGRPIVAEEKVRYPFRFHGRFTDPATGLVLFRLRWYDPTSGAFVQRDPDPGMLYRPETHNRYAFLENDPVNQVDPMGTQAVEWSRGSTCLEAVCELFQKGQVQASPAFGKALDGYRYVGAIDKAGWSYDVWLKQVPGTDRVLTVFRDLNQKVDGPYGKSNFTGNFMVPQSPPPPAAANVSQAAPSSGGVMNTLRQGVEATRQGVQLYGREVTGTVATLGGFWGTLNTSISTVASLPGGKSIVGLAAAVSAAVGYGIGTALNQIPAVSQAAQSLMGGALGYNDSQAVVDLTTRLSAEGSKVTEANARKAAETMKKMADAGIPLSAPEVRTAGGSADIGMPAGGAPGGTGGTGTPAAGAATPGTGAEGPGTPGSGTGGTGTPAAGGATAGAGAEGLGTPGAGTGGTGTPAAGGVTAGAGAEGLGTPGAGTGSAGTGHKKHYGLNEDIPVQPGAGESGAATAGGPGEGGAMESGEPGDGESDGQGDGTGGSQGTSASPGNDESEGGDEESETPPPPGQPAPEPGLYDSVFPVKIVMPVRYTMDASAGEFTNIISCNGTLSFTNLGALVPGNGAASMRVTCTASMGGASETVTATGTFSGGPDGTFTLSAEGATVSFSLTGGRSVTIPDMGTFPVPNPEAFANWPKDR